MVLAVNIRKSNVTLEENRNVEARKLRGVTLRRQSIFKDFHQIVTLKNVYGTLKILNLKTNLQNALYRYDFWENFENYRLKTRRQVLY